MPTLNVFHRDELIGKIGFDSQNDEFNFVYEQTWLEKKGFLLSPHIRPDGITQHAVRRFLENLLPEDKRLDDLTALTQISRANIFGLTLAIGQETTGALTILSGNTVPADIPTTFTPISETELRERILNREFHSIGHWHGKPRLSIAGVQDKLPICITPDGHFGFGEGKLASTHILKFGNKRDLHLVVNEWICMQLATHCQLPVAQADFLRFGEPVLKVTRFDRAWQDDEVLRHHVIDGCQLTNLAPGWKYEAPHGHIGDAAFYQDGVSFERLAAEQSALYSPAKDLGLIADWALFNLLCENSDAHGKNLSFISKGQRFGVTPLYDLLNIQIYGEEYEQHLAMAIGGEYKLADIGVFQLYEFASSLQLTPKVISVRLNRLCRAGLKAAGIITNQLEPLTADDREFAHTLIKRFTIQCERFMETAGLLKTAKF